MVRRDGGRGDTSCTGKIGPRHSGHPQGVETVLEVLLLSLLLQALHAPRLSWTP